MLWFYENIKSKLKESVQKTNYISFILCCKEAQSIYPANGVEHDELEGIPAEHAFYDGQRVTRGHAGHERATWQQVNVGHGFLESAMVWHTFTPLSCLLMNYLKRFLV